VGDFQPISLISGIFKILSNVLANKLKMKISSQIAPSQSSFLQGRSILNSVATAQEIIFAFSKNNWSTFFLKTGLR